MTLDACIRELVRRVATRALAERGMATFPAGREELPTTKHIGGVHVVIEPLGSPSSPRSIESHGVGGESSHEETLISARSLASTPDGGRFRLPRGAVVTDLAREEAWRRRIVFLAHDAHPSSARGTAELRVAVGSDHGGFLLKERVVEWLRELGHQPLDLGTHDEKAVDYPDFARAVAESVAERRADLGVVVDAAGIGSAIAANKVPGARAALCHDVAGAKNAREHNHANVLTLGARSDSAKNAREILRVFLGTREGGDRHARRVRKIDAIELTYSRRGAHVIIEPDR
jgi:ribose 5-phosphate isomerase B